MSNEEEENEKSIYNYNMIFNRINNYEEDTKINTDLINDIDLQNFDPKRYEYYTNLLYIYNKDPKTLYDLLNKYYNVKSMHQKEKGIIKYIYDYARKLKELEKDDKGDGGGEGDEGDEGGGAAGGGSIRRQRKRRNRQAGGVNTWQDKFINVLKGKMPKKEVKKVEASKPVNTSVDEDEDEDFVYFKEKDGVEELSKKIKALEVKIEKIETNKEPSLMKTIYERFFNKNKNKKIADLTEQITELDVKIADLTKQIETLKQPSVAVAKNPDLTSKITDLEALLKKLTEEQTTLQNTLKDELDAFTKNFDNELRLLKANTSATTPVSLPVRLQTLTPVTPQSSPRVLLSATRQDKPPDQLSNSLVAITDIANAVLTTSLSGLSSTPDASTPVRGRSSDTPVIANSITDLTTLAKSLGAGAAKRGGAGNSDEQLKMKYLDNLDNNKYKEINTWKKLKELKGVSKSQPESIDENNKIGQLSKDIDAYNYSDKDENDTKYIIQQLNNFENDPKNPLDELAITFDDRIVFIIATFFIRYITIIIVQWCIDINIIKTFYEGFIYYAIIYIIIFWFIVLFINIDNSYDVKYMNFNGIINSIRTLFYYFYMGTNGISRLLVHTSLIIILIIIPIILNIKRKADYVDDEQTETEKILNNDERKQLSKSLSLFTMFIWLFTSIIATKF